MLTIRLMRFGRRNRPFFRMVLVPKRSKPKSGKYIEMLGWMDPLKHKSHVEGERVKYWLGQGAKPSDTAWNLMVSAGVVEGQKIPKHKKVAPKAEAEGVPKAKAATVEVEASEASIQEAAPQESEAKTEETVEEKPIGTEGEKPAEEETKSE